MFVYSIVRRNFYMNYKKYQHIEKLGTSEVEGILQGEVHLSYKIDGSNGCIYLDNDELKYGSRNRELSLDNDNNKFVVTLSKDETFTNSIKAFLSNHPNYIIYGEWLVPVNIKRYKKDAWNKFYIFDIFDADSSSYLRPDIYLEELIALGLDVIPEIAVLLNPTEDDVKSYLSKTGGYLLDNGDGEGIVIKNYEYRNKYGRQTWAKILTEDFASNKRQHRHENHLNKEASPIEYEIISQCLTPEHILKEKSELIEKYGDWQSKMIFELLNRSFLEFYKDNWELILKKWHNPTINFKKLKQLSDDKVKEVLGI